MITIINLIYIQSDLKKIAFTNLNKKNSNNKVVKFQWFIIFKYGIYWRRFAIQKSKRLKTISNNILADFATISYKYTYIFTPSHNVVVIA